MPLVQLVESPQKGPSRLAAAAADKPCHQSSPAEPRRSARLAAKAQAQPPQPRRSSRLAGVGHGQIPAKESRLDDRPLSKSQRRDPAVDRRSTAKTRITSKPKSKPPPKAKVVDGGTTIVTQNQVIQQDSDNSKQNSKTASPTRYRPDQLQGKPNVAVSTWVKAVKQSEPLEDPETVNSGGAMEPQDFSAASRPDSGIAPSPSADPNSSQQKTTDSQATKRPRGQSAQARLEFELMRREVKTGATVTGDAYAEIVRQAAVKAPGIDEAQLAPVHKLIRSYLDKSRDGLPQKATDAERWRDLTRLRQQLNNMLPDICSYTETPHDFKLDQHRSQMSTSNEAVLQRTVLISAIDRARLQHSIFDYNCEGQWTISHELPLLVAEPQAKRSPFPAPKPDLDVSFRFKSLLKYLPPDCEQLEPPELVQCIHPDGSLDRCFSFLFIEAKRRDDSLDKATSSGIYAASQALYNIYQCLKTARQLNRLQNVRVFSISINAERLTARSHQIQPNFFNRLKFVHECILTSTFYNSHMLSTLVRSMLKDYAEPVLFGILNDTYQKLLLISMEHNAEVKKKLQDFFDKGTVLPADSTDGDSTEFGSGASHNSTDSHGVLAAQEPTRRVLLEESSKRQKSNHGHHSGSNRRQTRSEGEASDVEAMLSNATGVSIHMSQAGI